MVNLEAEAARECSVPSVAESVTTCNALFPYAERDPRNWASHPSEHELHPAVSIPVARPQLNAVAPASYGDFYSMENIALSSPAPNLQSVADDNPTRLTTSTAMGRVSACFYFSDWKKTKIMLFV